MIQQQIKLRLSSKQERFLNFWIPCLEKVWNGALGKIELDGKNGIFYRKQELHNLLAGQGEKIGIPSHTLQAKLSTAYDVWQRSYKKFSKKPKLKGARNKHNSIPFPDPIKYPIANRIKLPKIGILRFHKQLLPQGRLK